MAVLAGIALVAGFLLSLLRAFGVTHAKCDTGYLALACLFLFLLLTGGAGALAGLG